MTPWYFENCCSKKFSREKLPMKLIPHRPVFDGNFSDTLSEIISTHCELHCILSFEHARALQDISVHQCPGISYPTCQSPAAAVNSTSNFRLRQLGSLMITKFYHVVVLSSCTGTSRYISSPIPWTFLPNMSKSCRSGKFCFKS